MKVTRIALIRKFAKITLSLLLIEDIVKIILLILLFRFISLSPNKKHIVGISMKQISSFLLWTVKYENREKLIIDKPSWISSQKLKPTY